MNFKKLALASAVALAPVTGFAALDEMQDSSLSEVTGQDGIEISIETPAAGITGDIYIHDKDGLSGTATQVSGASSLYTFDGAIVVDDFRFIGNLNVTVDAGDNQLAGAGGAPTLNIFVNIPSATLITGDIRVANSGRDESTWGIGTTSAPLLSTMTIALSTVTMNIQLGNEPQGNMIALNTTLTGGLTISNFRLNDAGGAVSFTGGGIGVATTQIVGNASSDLEGNMGVNASNAGLVITVGTLGSPTGMDVRLTDVYVGSTSAGIIGDVTIVGLNLNGTTVTISGK